MVRRVWLFPFLALPLAAFHCGHGFPRVSNTLERPVAVTVLYRNGPSTSFELPPGSSAIAPPEVVVIDAIEVRSGEEILFTLEKGELERLRSNLPPGTRVMWEIHEDGVTPTVAPE